MELKRASVNDAETIWRMQKATFAELLEKYRDYETSPANETAQRVKARLLQPYTYFYYIIADNNTVGAVRVVDMKDGSPKRISPIFIAKEYRNRGYAQQAIAAAEKIHGRGDWELDTILQERGSCRLYEKTGYRQTGQTQVINERMTIVHYVKNL
ncbi:MAG: GNAT family N-acetyltransferase [Muribaculaceae bacterium]|nr:GNAT family N-acetyltransferase [Muribaculaceae bacterium]